MTYTPDEVRSFFNAHWTVRKYKQVTMPPEHLDVILEAAQRAPTDATAQMYSLVRLTDVELRTQIAELSGNAHIAQASEAFIVVADIRRLQEILKSKGYEPGEYPSIGVHFGIGDAVMAAQNMLIAAEMLGYRGCWIGGVINALDQIADLIELPHGTFPFAAMTIGVPDEDPKHRPRLPRAHVVHENRYTMPEGDSLNAGIEKMGPISARGDWPQTLARYFAKGGAMEQREGTLAEYLAKRFK